MILLGGSGKPGVNVSIQAVGEKTEVAGVLMAEQADKKEVLFHFLWLPVLCFLLSVCRT